MKHKVLKYIILSTDNDMKYMKYIYIYIYIFFIYSYT